MDGTETGWGRPAESAPRWRSLLDRALHGRADEPPGPDAANAQPPPAGGHRTGRFAGSGRYGREVGPQHGAAAFGPGQDPEHEPGFGGGYPGESRYAVLENSGYRPDPTYRPDGRPPGGLGQPYEPSHPAGAGYPSGAGYSADPGYRPIAEPGDPGESRWAALAPGYQPPPAPAQRAAPPVLPPRAAPPGVTALPQRTPVHAPPDRGIPAPRTAPPAGVPPTSMAPATAVPPAASIGYAPAPRRAAEPGYPVRAQRPQSAPDPEVERAISVLRRDLGAPRVLAFANPKGGVHKTTATVLAAATVGSVRGRGVLAWDDNELRGTLGLRAGSARHARTIRHLVADLIEIEARHGTDLINRLDDYLRHASDGSYDVLAGEESPRFAQRLDQHTVRRVLELLRRTHDVICVDTGNNVESSNWQTVLRAADQLVVTTVPREDAAFTADWMLDLLHDIGMGELAENAVTLLSCPTPGHSPLLDDLRRHFATRTRAVAVVPYDPALETGSSIEYAKLQPETRDAWLQAASMMIEPFVR